MAEIATSLAQILSPDSMSASGKDAAKLSLPFLQSKMKCDPEGYEPELLLLYCHFDSTLDLFRKQFAINPSSDPIVSKELADLAMFLAHVTPFYPGKLADFPKKIIDLLMTDGKMLPSSLRCHLAQTLILLVNRKMVSIEESLDLFMELQILGDRMLRKLCFSHVVHSIRRMNQKHKDELRNRKLQSILFSSLQGEEETRARRALVVLCDLHRRKVWFDDRTANAICTACFHSSSRIMISALSFLLGYEQVEKDSDCDASDTDDDSTTKNPQILLNKQDVYKAHHKGTSASKKKKQAKLQRAVRSMKRQQRLSSENCSSSSYSPLLHLKDAQGFAEKLFSRLQKCNERFEVKMMILKVIARAIGLHRLVLLNFYPFLQKYVQPHQRDITNLLAAAVQACHDMIPPDAVEPLFRQIVNQFIHDRSRTEAIAVGLNVVREICLRMPLLMSEDLLQDLVLYKKSHEKAISSASRSLISLFREICPSFLVKKDRGRPTDPKARPKAFGEVNVLSNVPGLELLEDGSKSLPSSSDSEDDVSDVEHVINTRSDGGREEIGKEGIYDESSEDSGEDIEEANDTKDAAIEIEVEALEDVNSTEGDFDGDDNSDVEEETTDNDYSDGISDDNSTDESDEDENKEADHKVQKRKFIDYNGSLDAANASLRALKRLNASKKSIDKTDGILSNEDFKRIKELQAMKELKVAASRQGFLKNDSDSKQESFKIPSSEHLSAKRVDPATLEVHIKRRISKEEKLALVKAGREERGNYHARAAVKQKKTGGLSNKQKEHKKVLPFAAKKAKVARSRQAKKKEQRRGGKQFRGRKAWK